MDHRFFPNKILECVLREGGEVSKQQKVKSNNLTITLSVQFLLLSVSFSHVFPTGRLCSKIFQHILDIVGANAKMRSNAVAQ